MAPFSSCSSQTAPPTTYTCPVVPCSTSFPGSDCCCIAKIDLPLFSLSAQPWPARTRSSPFPSPSCSTSPNSATRTPCRCVLWPFCTTSGCSCPPHPHCACLCPAEQRHHLLSLRSVLSPRHFLLTVLPPLRSRLAAVVLLFSAVVLPVSLFFPWLQL